MKILWAPNPLRTIVELDEADKRWFRERIKVEYLKDCMDLAHFELDLESRTWRSENGMESSLEDAVRSALARLDIEYNTCDEPRDGKTLDQRLEERANYYIESLSEEHSGDCICVPCSCIKCRAESLLGIDTTAGLGKHEATKILSAFKAEEGQPAVTIEQAIERLKNYRPVYRHSPTWPEEAWSQNVPRWIEEGRRAYAWLLRYREEHFKDAPAPIAKTSVDGQQ